ncbi:hypothetical protein DICVIV_08386 [Dictyocaulus viviparus]|uniref:Uncharacterized protein n=1 Tax=Dictyocaulus viviparus TaxID=29172 RepID=A0A0D8XP20_DICVI|nr:hypothetical protein DICVIV_08386 [Dictyocaulus viviparus]
MPCYNWYLSDVTTICLCSSWTFSCIFVCISFSITSTIIVHSCGRFHSNKSTKSLRNEKSKSQRKTSVSSRHEMQATSTKSLTIETKREKTVDDIKSKSVPLCKKSVVSNVDVAKTQDNDMEAKKLPKKKIAETTVKEICEYERKAANEGIVLQPDHVKHLGNIDDITQERKAQIEKDIESLKTDMEKTLEQNSKKGTDMKVRINENKCVLYETKDAETIDDQDDNDDVGAVDLY